MLRFPILAFAFVVEQLRRLPGARLVERHASLVVSGLLLAAVVALAVWMVQRSPQRISMAELVAGDLAPMQTWIVVSGDVRPRSTDGRLYTLTDPTVPDAVLNVVSEVELPIGHATVSGILAGGSRGAVPGYAWIGELRADSVLTREPDPPWIAIALAAVALFIALGARTFYPMFFRQAPRFPEPETMTLQVGVRRDWPPSASQVVPGTLALQRGAPVGLSVPGETQQLRLHSVHSIEVGELRGLRDSEPALVVRPATGELTITFASPDDRDAAVAVLAADVRRTNPKSVRIE